jgi:hypothetical protein
VGVSVSTVRDDGCARAGVCVRAEGRPDGTLLIRPRTVSLHGQYGEIKKRRRTASVDVVEWLCDISASVVCNIKASQLVDHTSGMFRDADLSWFLG